MTRPASPAARCAAVVAALLLSACVAVPPVPPDDSGEVLSGRLAVHVDAVQDAPAQSVSAAFELQGDPRLGRLNLYTPLGTVIAQARWTPGSVVLATPGGETEFADLDALTREVLGESLPVAAMFDWLRGRPWPGAASTAAKSPTQSGFTQLGWEVDLARFDQALIAARRERAPVVTVRAKLDRP